MTQMQRYCTNCEITSEQATEKGLAGDQCPDGSNHHWAGPFYCESCEVSLKGPSIAVHQNASRFADKVADDIFSKPRECRKHLLDKLREMLCMHCGSLVLPCYCESDD